MHGIKNKQLVGIVISVLFQLCCPAHLLAASSLRNLDNGSGFYDAQANCIMKDSKGFVWFGTSGTIQRFDGVRFLSPKNSEWLVKVNVIEEVGDDLLMVGTSTGLWRYDANLDIMSRIFSEEINFSVHSLSYINNKLYVGTPNGIYIIDDEDHVEHLSITREISAYNQIIGAFYTPKVIWFLSPEGVIAYNIFTDNIRIYDKGEKFLSNFTCIAGDEKRLYIGTDGDGVASFDIFTGEYFRFLPQVGNNSVSALSLRDEILCCGTLGSGVFFASIPNRQIFYSLSMIPNANNEYLASDMVSCLLMDELHVVWIGSKQYTGVDYLQFQNKPFQPYEIDTRQKHNYNFDCLYIKDDKKLLGTPYGFYYISETGEVEFFSSNKNNLGIISTFIEYKDGALIGTEKNGAFHLDFQTLRLRKFTDNLTVNSFTIDENQGLWIASSGGLHCFNEQLEESKVYTSLNSALIDDRVNYMYIDSQNRYWIATREGLQLMDCNSGTFSTEGLSDELLNLPPVTYMTEDNQGNFLFCFKRNRMFFCDASFKHSRYVCTPEDANYLGLNIKKVLQDRENNYWLIGSRGVVKGDSTLSQFALFSSTEGLPEPFSNDGQLYGDSIWLATPKGIVYANIHSVPQSAPTVITDFIVNGVSMLGKYQKQITKGEAILLEHNHNTLEISFATLTYDAPELMIYEYCLEGFDDKWKVLRGLNSIKFSNLPSGDYTFKVRRPMDKNGVQSFCIQIRPLISVGMGLLLFLLIGFLVLVGICLYRRKSFKSESFVDVVAAQLPPVDSPAVCGKNPHAEDEKYRFNKKITDEEARELIEKLRNYMIQERAFLNPDLKLAQVAEAVGTSTQTLSQILNVNLKICYYDFVNEYRINEFKCLIDSCEKDRYTLKALAASCGFNSYTTFFRAFKEATGITPNEYIQHKEQ